MKRILAAFSLAVLLFLCGLAGSAAAQTRTTVSVRLVDTLSSESSQPGDTFSATLAEPLIVGDRIVAQKEIGRASCRERGEIEVGGGVLAKERKQGERV